ncbi:chromosomal replication initiator protein DnaA [Candidatus Saccharibacteria bacterium]|jgi:chromosomal replication initiator protein dnaA|nr:chromosomal replication initiator protein DnaA [Candidatus Saccharibacteria bacterium]
MDELWKNILAELEMEPKIQGANFKTWFADTKLLSFEDGHAIIGLKNSFAITTINKKYLENIKKAFQNNGKNPKKITFEVTSSKKQIPQEKIPNSSPRKPSIEELIKKKTEKSKHSSGLNKDYTFENFIVGGSNELAYFVSQNVADNPGKRYNPLYFYGDSGLGKTHLMQAIGNAIEEKHPEMTVLYITIENFYRDFLENVRSKRQGYADKYRNVDVLIVDDIQFIYGKDKTQEEFFHTFNELHRANKQIILSSDRAPSSIPTLTDRLKSRFESGMTVDIQLPDFETRQSIVEARAEHEKVKLEPEVSEFIAENYRTNIREIIGAVTQLIAMAELRNIKPNLELAQGLIQNSRPTRPNHLNSKKIIDKTAKYFGVSKEDILGKSRQKDINHARQTACYLMKYELKMSFPQIGKEFSRDHSTIMNGVSKIEKNIKLDAEIRSQIEGLRDLIYE